MRLARQPGAGFGSMVSASLVFCAAPARGADETSRSMPAFGFEGSVRVGRDGESVTFDGYAPKVEPVGTVRIGPLVLQGRDALIHVRANGRNAKSTGSLAGIDRIVPVPAPSVAPGPKASGTPGQAERT
jgi:hypothetical protein